ncbi:MAG TPA: hypothetical protein VJ715_12265, partial [Pyrinomonadaceae bacterium]|nr:hypothetical protein [Pyrinomonadaceae bacterium]
MAQAKYRVSKEAPFGLFLRTKPKDGTKVGLMPMGQLVTKQADSGTQGWWEVSTVIDSAPAQGFASSKFLVADSEFTEPTPVSSVTAVHLQRSTPVKRSNLLHAFALNETPRPERNAGSNAATKATELTEIVKWLDVENKARYHPNPSNTYCNIYAYDYCYLSGVFLPRVWWLGGAIQKLKAGKPVSPVYAETVSELNANSLFNWLKEFGPTFGWSRTTDFTAMQNAANNGQVVIICAQHKKPNRSGHICPIVPETTTQKAVRSGATVTRPLQSQAGRHNRKYQTAVWW